MSGLIDSIKQTEGFEFVTVYTDQSVLYQHWLYATPFHHNKYVAKFFRHKDAQCMAARAARCYEGTIQYPHKLEEAKKMAKDYYDELKASGNYDIIPEEHFF